jgi:recombination protein RecR
MIFQYAESLTRLIEQFTRLPGIGPKTAQRLAFHILSMERPQVEAFAAALLDVKKKITTCPVCCNLTDVVPCRVCQDEQRSQEQLCIVEDSQDVLAIERTHEYKGLYHVLQGRISPIDGKGPEDLTLKELLDRLKNGTIKEVIIATNPNIEGETTALYLSKLIAPLGLKVTRIAHGVPVGGDLEYADTATLGRAITGRREI